MLDFFKKPIRQLKNNFKIDTADFVAFKYLLQYPLKVKEENTSHYTYEDFIKDNKEELSEEEFVKLCIKNQKKILGIYSFSTLVFFLMFLFMMHPINLFVSLIFFLKSIVYLHKIRQLQQKRLYSLKEFIVSAFKKNK